MHMLALHRRVPALRVLRLLHSARIMQLSRLSLHRPLCALHVAVVELAVDSPSNAVRVLLRKGLAGRDRLDGAVVVVLVHFLLDRGRDFFVLRRLDGLLLHGRGGLLVDGGVVVAGLGHHVADHLLGLVHGHVGGLGVVDGVVVGFGDC